MKRNEEMAQQIRGLPQMKLPFFFCSDFVVSLKGDAANSLTVIGLAYICRQLFLVPCPRFLPPVT
jgi:hypothetical protein